MNEIRNLNKIEFKNWNDISYEEQKIVKWWDKPIFIMILLITNFSMKHFPHS